MDTEGTEVFRPLVPNVGQAPQMPIMQLFGSLDLFLQLNWPNLSNSMCQFFDADFLLKKKVCLRHHIIYLVVTDLTKLLQAHRKHRTTVFTGPERCSSPSVNECVKSAVCPFKLKSNTGPGLSQHGYLLPRSHPSCLSIPERTHTDMRGLVCRVQRGRRCPRCAYVMCPAAKHVSDPCQGPHPLKHSSGFCLGNWHWQVQLLSAFLWQPHLWHNPPLGALRRKEDTHTHTRKHMDTTQYQVHPPFLFPPLSLSLSSVICSHMVSNGRRMAWDAAAVWNGRGGNTNSASTSTCFAFLSLAPSDHRIQLMDHRNDN